MSRLSSSRLVGVVAVTAALTLGAASVAQAAPAQPGHSPAPSPSWQRVPSGPTGPQLPGATAFGDTPGDTPEQVTFVLAAQRLVQLEQSVLAGSKRRLSVPQFAASYGQSARTIAELTRYLGGFGIRSTVLPNRLDIETTGTATAYDRALDVSQKQYRVPGRPGRPGGEPGRAQNVHAPTRAPQLPPQLASDVTAVFGLSNYSAFASQSVAAPGAAPGEAAGAASLTTAAKPISAAELPARSPDGVISEDDCLALWSWPRMCNLPQDFASQYGLDALGARNDGTGQTIGIVTFAALDEGAPEYFWQDLALTPQRPRTVTVRDVDGGPGAPSDDSDETDLDVEQAGGVAPGANIVVYQAPNTDAGGVDALFQAAADDVAGSVSMSWGESETLVDYEQADGTATAGWQAAYDLAFLELAAQGQSTFVASGDTGAYDAYLDDPLHTTNLAVSAFAASPYVTAAGGTTLPYTVTIFGPTGETQDVTVPSERAWSSDYLWATYSQLYFLDYSVAAKLLVDTASGFGAGGGGGGYSTSEPVPPYQRAVPGGSGFTAVKQLTPSTPQPFAPGVTLPTDWTVTQHPALVRGRASGRAVPDLAADADAATGYLVYSPELGGLVPTGGTSVVAPQLAGAAAVMNQADRQRTGFWNPAMYRAAAGRNSPFTPLSTAGTGNDDFYYTGTPGTVYNPATGLGTPNLAELAAVLK